MSKKDKKIAIQVADAKVMINQITVDGYQLTIGKKIIGSIAEIDGKFATVKNENVDAFFKSLDQAVENVIENYNLNH